MRKLFISLCLVLALFASGCAKGEITLEISRLGAANINCKLVALPVISSGLKSFQEDFAKDGYSIAETTDGNMSGFIAHKHYSKISDVKDSKVLETFRFDKLQAIATKSQQKTTEKTPATEAKPEAKTQEDKKTSSPMVQVDQGLLFDTVKVNTALNLKPDVKVGLDQQFFLQNIMKQISLKFILILPTKAGPNNASTVSEDGKTLTWVLPVGENTPMQASVTFLNPIKAASWLALVVLIGLGIILYSSYKKRKGVVNK